jgi:uncharacterized membrane protein
LASSLAIGYVNYTILLLLLTGGLILQVDVKNYKSTKLVKEKKLALVLGWLNLALGAAIFVGNWIYQRYLW